MMTDAERSASYYLFALLCACSIVAILDRQVFSVLVGPVRSDLGISDVAMGAVQGPAFGIAFALFTVPLAYYSDRGSRRAIIAFGLLVWGMATVVSGVAPTLTVLVLGRMALALGEAVLTPAAHSLTSDLFPRHQLSRALGVLSAAANMSAGLSALIAGGLTVWLASTSAPTFLQGFAPWRLTMIVIALPAPILAVLLMTTTRDPRRSFIASMPSVARPISQIWSELRRDHFYLLLVILGFGALAAHFYGQMSWFPSYLMRVHDMPLAAVSLKFGVVVMLSGVAGPMLGGILADSLYSRFGARAPLVALIGATAAAISQAIAPLASTPTHSILIFGVGAVCFSAATPCGGSIIQLTTAPETRARVAGVWVCVFNLVGLGLGPVLIPLAAKHLFGSEAALGPALVLCSSILLLLAGGAFVIALLRTRVGLSQPVAPN
jgi:MFS family permease